MSMLASPALPPRPLVLGDVVSGTLTVMKRRLGLFVALSLLPLVVVYALVFAVLVLLVAVVAAQLQTSTAARAGTSAVVVLLLGIVVTVVVSALAQLKFEGMTALAAYDVAQGGRPTLRDVWGRTAGLIPRCLGLIAAIVGLAIVVPLAWFGLLIAVIRGAQSNDSAAVGVLSVVLVSLALAVAAFIVAVRIIYLLPALGIEGVTGIGALKRSWQLTRGVFWRTLGYYLIALLLVYAANLAVSSVTSLLTQGFAATTPPLTEDSVAEAVGRLTTLLPAVAIAMVLALAVQTLTTPFLGIYRTVMYIDQVRRPPEFAAIGAPWQQAGNGTAFVQPGFQPPAGSNEWNTPAPPDAPEWPQDDGGGGTGRW